MSGPDLSDLIFPEANHNFSAVLSQLKRANLSIANRLSSIQHDAGFVASVAAIFGRPLVANERCGSWYIPPPVKAASAYFKSTDGHTGQWSFSTRRLNLHLLPLIDAHDGCIIVDSTRRGKRMPDALSKTVPMWCCVLNRALFPDQPDAHGLYTPPTTVSASEHSQMLARIPQHVDAFAQLGLDTTALGRQLSKPIRPFWVTPDTQMARPPSGTIFDGFRPVICCTSSRRVVGAEMSEGGYIQGAGDDTENWALGLTAPVFWAHADRLLAAAEADLPHLLESVVAEDRAVRHSSQCAAKEVAPGLLVGPLPMPEHVASSRSCTIALLPKITPPESWTQSDGVMLVGVGKQKVGSRNLRRALPAVCLFVSHFLRTSRGDGREARPGQVLIYCETGKDLSIGVALALLCQSFDDQGTPGSGPGKGPLNKTAIRAKLSRMMTVMPEANPSRATLQSVNSFLMNE